MKFTPDEQMNYRKLRTTVIDYALKNMLLKNFR